jgi:hypothetical protein
MIEEMLRCGVIPCREPCKSDGELSVRNATMKLTIASAALAAGLCGHSPPSRAAAGAEPWCIVTDEGNNRCNYASSQECLAAIAGGEHGFCNVNSTPGPSSAAGAQPARRKRR